jgi:hypothetical protein
MKKLGVIFFILDIGVQLVYEFVYRNIANYIMLPFYIIMMGLLIHYFRKITGLMMKHHMYEYLKNKKNFQTYFIIFLCNLIFNFALVILEICLNNEKFYHNMAGLIESCLITTSSGTLFPEVVASNIMIAISGIFNLNVIFTCMAVVLTK